jgi:hypothetical protein
MPAKKKSPAKKKTAAKKKTSTAKKKTTKKKTTKKKTAPKKKAVQKDTAKPKPHPKPEPVVEKKPKKPKKVKKGIPCDHCDATGVCAAGNPYDKTRGQQFGAQVRITSCVECLNEAGEHKNSKKLVNCRFCDGDGEI